jgi:hypothetical protein
LRLWPGSLWAAFSPNPTEASNEQSPISNDLTPSELVADAVKRSSVAHLFQFYPVLCEIASIPRPTPSAWVLPNSHTKVGAGLNGTNVEEGTGNVDWAVRLDARSLARACLKEIGKEMGLS